MSLRALSDGHSRVFGSFLGNTALLEGRTDPVLPDLTQLYLYRQGRSELMEFPFYRGLQPPAPTLAGVAVLTQRYHTDKTNLLHLLLPKAYHNTGAWPRILEAYEPCSARVPRAWLCEIPAKQRAAVSSTEGCTSSLALEVAQCCSL